jgi:acyl carrier protein
MCGSPHPEWSFINYTYDKKLGQTTLNSLHSLDYKELDMAEEKDVVLEEIRTTLKVKLIEQLSLEDISADEITDDMPLFGEGLGLDSLDAVEIIVLLQRNFEVEVKDAQESRAIFQTVNTLAEYIYQQKNT